MAGLLALGICRDFAWGGAVKVLAPLVSLVCVARGWQAS